MVDLKLDIPEEFYEDEIRSGFTISRERKKVWAVELDLLYVLMEVCRKYNLHIYADAGTCLGAVRHSGFIPWDDDIDVVMTRRDYNRLCKVASEEFLDPYFFQTELTDPGSMRGHAQLRNSQTTGILKFEEARKFSFNQGIFIDIFPLDNIPDDRLAYDKFIGTAAALKENAFRYSAISSRFRRTGKMSFLKRIIYFLWGRRHVNNPFYNKFEGFIQSYNGIITKRLGKVFTGIADDKLIWEKSWLDKAVYKEFEILSIPLPCGYLDFLRKQYGNWEIPMQQPNMHGEVIFDTSMPYYTHWDT